MDAVTSGKKLKEGIPEHRDMIFRETFGHFANLTTGTISVFFCLAHDIYASARSVRELSLSETAGVLYRRATESYLRISSVDMVNISLNMHGTRAVQKMIDFLSTGRQASLIPSTLSLQNLRWRV